MIISSLLDLDYYKLTMAQFVWKRFRDVPVTYAFANRTKQVRLADHVAKAELEAELNGVRSLRFREYELAWLAGLELTPGRPVFNADFLDFLRGLRLPTLRLEAESGQFRIEAAGSWPEAILWETLTLSVMNELYYRTLERIGGVSPEVSWTEGRFRLLEKLRFLRFGAPTARLIEFGTRRRYSRVWQRRALEILHNRCPDNLVGTSNVRLAMEFGLKPIGTFAHELFMVLAAVAGAGSDGELRASHGQVLRHWWDEYGEPLSIALTDTFGTDSFFGDFAPEQARDWRGLRQDSGDPVAFGERAIRFYQGLGIDPRTKTVVFSDGLDADAIISLERRFAGRLGTAYGWGTNLSNDCGFAPLSLVVKAAAASGRPTVKLSDNLAKAMGPVDEVERYKRVFGYRGDFTQECVY